MRTRLTCMLGGLLLALVSGASGCNRSTEAGAAREAVRPASAETVRVQAVTPVRKSLELFTSQPGRIRAYEETPLHAKLAGYVRQVLVDRGDRVEEGQELVILSIPELNDEIEQKKALLAQAEAEVAQAEAAVKAAEAAADTAAARISQAEAGDVRANAEFERWLAEHARIRALAERGSVTTKLVDETQSQLRAAEAAQKEVDANVRSAKAAATEAAAYVLKAKADLLAAEARKKVAEADLARATTMIGYAVIKSPFRGVVTDRTIDTGHYVHPASSPGAKPLVTVTRTDRVRISVDVPEQEADWVTTGEQGDEATIRVPALRGKELQGRVTRCNWSLNAANRSLETEVELENPEGLLRPGMFATVTIRLEKRDDILVLPVSAVIGKGDQAWCCAVDSGSARRVKVAVGLRSGDEIEVSGCDGVQWIVTRGADALREGEAVSVIQPKP